MTFTFLCDKCTIFELAFANYEPMYPCIVCDMEVKDGCRAVTCDECKEWIHVDCTGQITPDEYDELVRENIEFDFKCDICSCLPIIRTYLNLLMV